MRNRKLGLLLAVAAASVSSVFVASAFAGSTPAVEPQLIDDSALNALSTTEGGADVLPTTRTIPHWFGQTTDPHNGVTYGYNMVGSDPNSCSGSACSTTIEADITPIIVHVAGRTYDGTRVVPAVLASPQFATNDYAWTPAATAANVYAPPAHSGCSTAVVDVLKATPRSAVKVSPEPPASFGLPIVNVIPCSAIWPAAPCDVT